MTQRVLYAIAIYRTYKRPSTVNQCAGVLVCAALKTVLLGVRLVQKHRLYKMLYDIVCIALTVSC